MFQSINPFTEEVISETTPLSDKELDVVLQLCSQRVSSWSELSVEKRCQWIRPLIQALKDQKQSLALLATQEMGKPLGQSLAEVEKCIFFCEYSLSQAPDFLADRSHLPFAPAGSFVSYQALGVLLGIMPWNFPFWQIFRFALPSILAGNTVMVKSAPNVMGCGMEVEKLFLKAGFPEGTYKHIPISLEQTAKVIADPCVQGVSLTGSVRAGKAVASLAGQHIKKTVLELGGSDAYLILDSASLEFAAKKCVISRMNNNGQSCIAAKRLIVVKDRVSDFTELLIEEMKKFEMGNPTLPNTSLGPLARLDLREGLHRQVCRLGVGQNSGPQVLLGGQIPNRKGYFYPPTVLRSMEAKEVADFREELFGPAVLVISVPNEQKAIEVANASPYGLGAGVFSGDVEKAEKIAREKLRAGTCVVNQCLHSHPALPFGGIKESGYGRELSEFGFYEFVNMKTVKVKQTQD